MKSYDEIRDEATAIKDGRDCTVVMVAAVCDIPYPEAHRRMKEAGRVDGQGAGSGVYDKVIRDLGFNIQRISNNPRFSRNYVPEGIRPVKAKTVRTIERELARYWGGVKVYINVPGHILAWNGKEIVDWSAGRLHRVRSVHMVYKGDMPSSGVPVKEPERHDLRSTYRPASAVLVTCEDMDVYDRPFKSMPAAYKALGFSKKGRQQARKCVKYYGEQTFWVWSTVEQQNMRVTMKLIK